MLVETARCYLTRSNFFGYFVFFPLGVFPVLVLLFFPVLPNSKPSVTLRRWLKVQLYPSDGTVPNTALPPVWVRANCSRANGVRLVYSKAVYSSIYRTHYTTPYNHDILLSLCFQPINFTRCEANSYIIALQTLWRFRPFSSLVSLSTMLITLTTPTLSCYCHPSLSCSQY